MRLIGRWIAIGVCALSLVVALPFQAERVVAAGYTVTTTSDSGPGSLRDAITQVNAGAGTGDTIAITATGKITLTSALPALAKPVAITGPGAALLTVSGSHAVRVFDVHTGVTVSIANLTIADGNELSSANSEGGGIRNSGTLTVTNSTITGNIAVLGGGILNNGGTLTVTNSTLSRNSASAGGGIENTGTLTVTNCTITANGAAGGGGIDNDTNGTVTVTNSTLSGNGSTNGKGGGISNNFGTMTVTNSALSGNTATNSKGGGISNNFGTMTVTNSTFSGNSASGSSDGSGGDGGGIHNNDTLAVTNSTFSGNSVTTNSANGGYGGGIYAGPMLTVTNSTFSGNSAIFGGGISSGGTPTVTNTIIAGNTATGTGPDINGAVVSHGHNLIGNTSGGSGFVTSDLQNVNPALGPLASNGGPTQTRALLPGSPAIDAGDDAVCNLMGVGKVNAVDQRGVHRPQRAHCDIGAFEAPPPVPAPLPTPRPGGGVTGVPAPLPPMPRPDGPHLVSTPAPLPVPRP